MAENTTQQVSKSNMKRMKEFGEFGDSFNDVLTNVLDECEVNASDEDSEEEEEEEK